MKKAMEWIGDTIIDVCVQFALACAAIAVIWLTGDPVQRMLAGFLLQVLLLLWLLQALYALTVRLNVRGPYLSHGIGYVLALAATLGLGRLFSWLSFSAENILKTAGIVLLLYAANMAYMRAKNRRIADRINAMVSERESA